MKRLYKDVAVNETDEGFAIALDGRLVKLPGGKPLRLPTRALAEGVAEEWHAQGEKVIPDTMPLMQLSGTVLGGIAADRPAIEGAVMRYAETDLICYHADQPAELVRMQRAAWQPLLDWLTMTAAVSLEVTTGFLPIAQKSERIARLGERVRAMDDWELGAFQAAASASGSFVIALALMGGRIDVAQAFAAAELDENYFIAKWGEDVDAALRRKRIAADLAAARRFHDLLEGERHG